MVLGLGLLVSVPLCMAIGWTAERVAYRPLRARPPGGADHRHRRVHHPAERGDDGLGPQLPELPASAPRVFEIFGARISTLQIAIVVIAALIMGGLLAVVHKTRLGTAMRATAQNREVAGLMGVNINTVISAAFLIGSALAAVAGMMVATYYGVSQYTMGFMLGLKAFTAAVLGGIGNLVGAMAGGLLLGIIESLGAGYIGDLTGGFLGSHYQDVFAFFVLVLVLIFRPSGLLGERVGTAHERDHEKSGLSTRNLIGIALIGIVLAVLPFVIGMAGQSWVRILNFALLRDAVAGLNIVVGFAGLLDLGYIAFYAVGAYAWAMLASPHFGLHLPFWAILPIALAVACLFGVLLGRPRSSCAATTWPS